MRWLTWLCCWAFLSSPLVSQQIPQDELSISQMYHRSWTVRDGVPDSIWQITQTADGFLWLGSATGLVRFDGLHFRHYPAAALGLLSDNILSVRGLDDGSLWIGYQFGGASLYRQGKLTNFPPGENGLPRGALKEFIQRDGVVWATTTYGLAFFDGHHWKTVGSERGFRNVQNYRSVLDQYQNLWVSDHSNSLQLLQAGAKTFIDSGLSAYEYLSFVTPQAGWATGPESFAYLLRDKDGRWRSEKAAPLQSFEISLFDRHGALWLGSLDDGLYRLPARYAGKPGPIRVEWLDRFTSRDGLSGKMVVKGFEDREGGMWFATNKGLDYFRHVPFHAITLPGGVNGVSIAVLQDKAVAAFDGPHLPSYQIEGTTLQPIDTPQESITSIFADPNGCLWLGGDGHVYQRCGTALRKFVFPGPMLGRTRLTQAISVARDGDAWISVLGETPLRLHDGQWLRDEQLAQEPLRTPLSVFTSSNGEVYFGYQHGVLYVQSHGSMQQITKPNQIRLGNIAAMTERNGHIWFGGSDGLAILRRHAVQPITPYGTDVLRGISGIVERSNGDLWLNTTLGAVLIPQAEIAFAEHEPGHQVRIRTLNFLDGFPGAPEQTRPLPTLREMNDGRLLFASREALAWLDPDHLPKNTVAPGISIDQMMVEKKSSPLNNRLELQEKPQDITFEIAAGSLLVPERTHILYNLSGFDDTWRDAGQDRSITYVKLPPGKFTLNLQAVNDSGLPGEIQSLSFSIPPTFFQSWRFKLLCSVLALGVVWLVVLLRIRFVTDRVQRTFSERRAERERIAGDLHDDFFQGIQGLLLRFQATSRLLANDHPARIRLDELLDESDQVMLEGRELVFELRTGSTALGNVAEALAELGRELEKTHGRSFVLDVEGDARRLSPVPGDELLKIVREALWNAFRHSQAKAISLRLKFESKDLLIEISDNGIGIDREVLDAGQREGHFGLPGMRERAQRIRGTVTIVSRKGHGTRITISAPAKIIYESVSKSGTGAFLHKIWNARDGGSLRSR